MIDTDDLEKHLQKDINQLKKKIVHPNIYNLKICAKKTIFRSAIVLNRVVPFVVSGIILSNSFGSFIRTNEVKKYAQVEKTITSTGIELEETSFTKPKDKDMLQHSTAWKQNSRGLYERTLTTYLFEFQEQDSEETLLSMSEEELRNRFIISNIEVFQKSYLTKEDLLYEEDMILLTTFYEDKKQVKYSQKSILYRCGELFAYNLLIFLLGLGLTGVVNVLIKPSIYKRLKYGECKLEFV